MSFLSHIGYALFPLASAGYDGSINSFIHVYVITIPVVTQSIFSLVYFFRGFRKSRDKGYAIIYLIILLLMISSIAAPFVPKNIFGIVERISTYSIVIYTFILSTYFFRN
ncbi:MAG: DUF998 domain-containing protein [Ezakiella sp.]|nr:DUF998 domain-containing protein [Ezakiella sp.]